MQLIVLALTLATPAELTNQELEDAGRQAVANDDHRTAAESFDALARRLDIGEALPWTIAATSAWRRDYDQTQAPESLCAALDLLRHFATEHDHPPPDVDEYWSLVEMKRTAGVSCEPEEEPEVHPPRQEDPPTPTQEVPPGIPTPTLNLTSHPAPPTQPKMSKPRRLVIAGGVLTGLGVVGLATLAGQTANYVPTIRQYRDHNRDELYQQAYRQETAMIVTGITTGAVLVSGIVLLAVHKRLHIQPNLSGVSLRGQF